MSDSMKLHSREDSYELINQYWVCPNIWYMGLLIQNKKYGKELINIIEGSFKCYVTLPRGEGKQSVTAPALMYSKWSKSVT